MNVIIVYATQHGCTEQCAEKIRSGLDGDVMLVNLKKQHEISVEDFDTVIIGGSIHAGNIQGRVKKFCNKTLDKLLKKRIGLFICCMEEGDKAEEQFNNGFPKLLIDHAIAKSILGGAFNFEKMNAVERFIIKKIAKTDQSVNKVSDEKIKQFIYDIKK